MTAAAALCALPAARAGADELESVYGAELEETSHAVRIRLAEGTARYVVRRSMRNIGDISDQISLSIDLPSGATAVGLRVRDARGRWHAAKLLAADAARESYDELTDISGDRAGGRTARRRPTLLGWTSAGELELETFPVRVGERVTVEYTLVAPTCYADGRIWLDYPHPTGAAGFVEPVLAVETGPHGGQVTLHGPGKTDPRELSVDEMCDAEIQAAAGAVTVIEVAPRDITHAAIRYGVYRTAGARAVARIDIDAAPVLERAPRAPSVVFVLDGSWSTGDARLADQLALVRGYLAHVPDARFEVVVFRRRAERLLGRFAAADEIDEVVAALPDHRRALGNGSNLERGVALAANLLSGARGPVRVVAFTDGRTRAAFTPELAVAALAPLPRGSVVHVAVHTYGYGAMTETRVDDHPLAPIAAAFGGVLLELGGDTEDVAAVAQTMLGLVRPIRIDEFTIEGGGVEALESVHEPGLALDEGTGERHMLLLADAPRALRITGMIWGRRWARTIEVSGALSAELPALVFGNELHAELETGEQLAAAKAAGAVSPQTSYLEAEQRVVPIPEDLANIGGLGLRGTGVGCGCGGFGTSSMCGGIGIGGGYGSYEERPTPEQLLRAWMLPRVAMCARAAGVARVDALLTIEATGDEVVDVAVEGELSSEVRTCITDAAWELRLTSEFSEPHGTYAARLRTE